MRQKQILRHWKILRRLENLHCGMTPNELAAELNVSVRTIYRDLITLQDAGFPISNETSESGNRYFLTQKSTIIDKLLFGPSELLALYLSQGILSQLRGTIFQEAIDRLLQKVNEVIPESAKSYFKELETSILIELFSRRDYKKKAKEIQAILTSLRDKRTLNAIYFSPNRGELKREIDPYCLWVMGDSLYLIGFCHINKEIRTFLVDRIKKATPTKKNFSIKSGFDFRKYTTESFRVMRGGKEEEFELRFEPQIAYLIKERIWSPNQILKEHPDRSITLSFKVKGLEEVKSWVLSFGELVEVIKPQKLKEQIKNSCQKILQKYN